MNNESYNEFYLMLKIRDKTDRNLTMNKKSEQELLQIKKSKDIAIIKLT